MPEIERTIATMVPGGTSDMIETPDGFHIVRLEDKKPKQFRPYEQVRNEIQGLVFQQKSEDAFQSWLANLKNKAYIEIKFESALSEPPTTAPAPPRHRRVSNKFAALDQSQPLPQPTKRTDTFAHF